MAKKLPLYAERDVENLPAYFDHVMAMTGESLHSKSAIAAELAYRDNVIADLREVVAGFQRAAIQVIERHEANGLLKEDVGNTPAQFRAEYLKGNKK